MLSRHKPNFYPTVDRGTHPCIQPPYLNPILGWVDIRSGDKLRRCTGCSAYSGALVALLATWPVGIRAEVLHSLIVANTQK